MSKCYSINICGLGHIFTRDNSAQIERRDGAMRPSTFRDGTVEAIIATQSDVRRRDARGEFVERLLMSGADLSQFRGASVLDAHAQGGVASVLGVIDECRIENNQLVVRIRFSDRPEIAGTVRDIEMGILNSLSVGYEVREWQDSTDPSTGIRVRTAAKWVPREASFVPIPADPHARTRRHDPGFATLGDRAAVNREIRITAQTAGISQQVIDDLIDRGVSLEQANIAILSELVNRSQVHIRSAHNSHSLDNPEVFQRAVGEALYCRVAPSLRPSPEARQYIGLTIPDIARTCLQRQRISVEGMGAASLVTRALQTTSDFPLILADTVGRTLRDSYTAAPASIKRLGRETTAPDFRAKHRLMLDSSGVTLEKVNEHGEFKSGSFIEGEETYKLATYGKIIGFSRQAMINDDLAAFSDVTRRLGLQAAAFENQFLVDLLVSNAGLGPVMADGKALFHTDHGNLAGSGAAPSETTLNAARLAMRRQVSLAGEPIDCSPWAVVIPPELETATEKVLTAIQAVQVSDVNPFSRLQLIVETRLLDAKVWYVAANPATTDGLEYCYLAGSPGPQTETQLGFDVDGLRTKVRLDFGAGFVDHRGLFRNPGQ